jgi:cation transport ATPase
MPLFMTLCLGGLPLILQLWRRLLVRDFGSDLLAGIAIVASLFVHQYLVGSIIVLMLSGGTALEHYAVRRASSVLEALARRMPRIAHRRANCGFVDVSTDEIAVGDTLIVLPTRRVPWTELSWKVTAPWTSLT